MYLPLVVEILVNFMRRRSFSLCSSFKISWTYLTIYAKILHFLILVLSKKNKKVQDCGVKVVIFFATPFCSYINSYWQKVAKKFQVNFQLFFILEWNKHFELSACWYHSRNKLCCMVFLFEFSMDKFMRSGHF